MVNEHNSRMNRKKKKRKDRSSDEPEELLHSAPSKSCRRNSPERKVEQPETEMPDVHMEEPSPWRNLQLILSLQNRNLDLHTKLELAFNYVKSRTTVDANESTEVSETVSIARVVEFVSNWIQTVLISSVKKVKVEELKTHQKNAAICLDHRCWIIFKFCLEESVRFEVSLCILRDFLRVIEDIVTGALSSLSIESYSSGESVLSCHEQDLPKIVLDCVDLVFSSHGGVSIENSDLWITTICVVLKLLQKVVADKLDESREGNFVIKLSSYLLEPFAVFLRVHPIRKNSFSDFIDRLLEPLMHLLDALHNHTCSGSLGWPQNLFELVKDVLAQGLFHQTHLDGYMSLHSADKYQTCDGERSKVEVRVIKSYHRHLFDNLEKIIATRNPLPLGGIAPLFQLFVSCVTKHKGGFYIAEGSKHPDGSSTTHMFVGAYRSRSVAEGKYHNLSSVDAERRKSLFDFFVRIMEYFLHQINTFTQAELEVEINWLDILYVLKSSNKLLETFKQEGIYTRLDDTSEGACVNFLRLIYESVMSFAFVKVNGLLFSSSTSNKEHQEVQILLMKELVLAVHCLLDIEYEVVDHDLGRLWGLMLSFSACSHSLAEASNHHLLNSQILHLGCRLIELYKELRQVNAAIFALCEAVRLLVSPVTECQKSVSKPYSSCVISLSMLLCAPEFRHSICSAIKSIPEGQTGGCIQQLATDISDSLEWLKVQCQLAYGENILRQGHDDSGFQYGLQAELLGRYLTEVYTLILDSVTVTAGNSYPVSISVNSLMVLICPSSSVIDSVQSERSVLFSFIFGKIYCDGLAEETFPVPHWILLFFFRLYLSCRNLSQQVLTLVPLDISRKLSKIFNDSFTTFSRNDLLAYGGQNTEDSFFFIVKGSTSVLTIVETISNVYLHNSSTLCPPLVYVMCAIALQRLADLNRKLKSFEYFLAKRSELVETITDGTRKPLYQKKSKKTMKGILNMKEEAAGLTKFILAFVEDKLSILVSKVSSQEKESFPALHEDNGWDYSIGALDEMSLPSAVWLIVCQNVDLWCAHASKKAIKKFLTLLIRFSIPVDSCVTKEPESNMRRLGPRKKATLHQTSRELLCHTVLYEQRFVCRHLASTICQILMTSVSSIFPTLGDVHLNSTPNWVEIIDVLETLNNHTSQEKHAKNNNQLQMKLSSQSLSRLLGGPCRREQLAPATCIEHSSSQEFLNFVTWMPKGYLSSKSLLLMANCILNLERIVVGSLLSGHGALRSEDQFQLLRLFLSCRRTLKSLFVTSFEKTDDHHFSCLYLPSKGTSSVLWLFESLAAVIECQSILSEDIASQVEDMLFSLMDHTSCTLHTIAKSLTERVLKSNEKDCGGKSSDLIDLQSEFPSNTDLVACLLVVGEKLRDDIQNSIARFNSSCGSRKGDLSDFQKLKKVSPVISCIQAFLWGLASGLEITCASSHTSKKGLSKCKVEPLRKLSICVDACTEIINYFLGLLILQDDPSGQSLLNARVMSISETGQSLLKNSDNFCHVLDEEELPNAESLENILASNDGSGELNNDFHARTGKISSKRSKLDSILAKGQLSGQQCSKGPLLQRLLGGKKTDVAYFLRHLFFASSARLRLKFDNACTPLLQTLVPVLNSIPQYVSFEFANKDGAMTPFAYVWLDGIVKFLEELGNSLSSSNPLSSTSSFTNLMDLHLRFFAACIVIQGKRAAPASPVSNQVDFRPSDRLNFCESKLAYKTSCLDELKNRLRSSFGVLIQKSSELHLLSAIQVIQGAVGGLQGGCRDRIYSKSSDGGNILATVAAGVECLDLVLEFVTGRKRLSVVKSHIRSMVSSLFSTIVSLQGPNIFLENKNAGEGCLDLDSASVILTCIEAVTRVFGKRSLPQMDSSSHIAQSLHIPAVIFQNLLQLGLSGFHEESNLTIISDGANTDFTDKYIFDQWYSLELYGACCRLLCTVIKHHASDAQRCVALLEDSVNVLLYCLETINIDPVVKRGNITWDVQGVKCASCLKRVFEELRQQKDEFGRYCYQFLSCYIWVYNGYGLLKSGFKREIDEAMRPGVYALIDACSADDLQHLHTVFGEGPCRITLGALIDDYKLNFRYEGKV